MSKPRLLIEEWLPVQAIGIECMRERSTGQQPPDKRLHVWWARRPLTVSRAAVLASVLPADFDRRQFERLLGMKKTSAEILGIRARMDSGEIVDGGFGYGRAFANALNFLDLDAALTAMLSIWGESPTLIDPMAGGGSIPLEATRLGLDTFANELNPVACSVLESTLDYPFRLGSKLAERARHWAALWEKRCAERLSPFYPREKMANVYTYLYARTVPCPDTGHPTPLIPDWTLMRRKNGAAVVAEPFVTDAATGRWTIRVREVGKDAGQLRQPPQPTYGRGSGVSLFKNTVISDDYIRAMAQQGKMGSALYAIGTKATTKLEFRPADDNDRRALQEAERELGRLRPQWERDNIIPTETIPPGDKTAEPIRAGMVSFADMFSARQLLALGVMVEELRRLQPEIDRAEGQETGEAVIHLLALVVDKFANYNAILSSWNVNASTLRSVFDRHDYAFKAGFAELAPCVAGGGLAWAIDSVV